MKWEIWLNDTHLNVLVLKFSSKEAAEEFYTLNADHLVLSRNY